LPAYCTIETQVVFLTSNFEHYYSNIVSLWEANCNPDGVVLQSTLVQALEDQIAPGTKNTKYHRSNTIAVELLLSDDHHGVPAPTGPTPTGPTAANTSFDSPAETINELRIIAMEEDGISKKEEEADATYAAGRSNHTQLLAKNQDFMISNQELMRTCREIMVKNQMIMEDNHRTIKLAIADDRMAHGDTAAGRSNHTQLLAKNQDFMISSQELMRTNLEIMVKNQMIMEDIHRTIKLAIADDRMAHGDTIARLSASKANLSARREDISQRSAARSGHQPPTPQANRPATGQALNPKQLPTLQAKRPDIHPRSGRVPDSPDADQLVEIKFPEGLVSLCKSLTPTAHKTFRIH
jgi:hypothetical protein